MTLSSNYLSKNLAMLLRFPNKQSNICPEKTHSSSFSLVYQPSHSASAEKGLCLGPGYGFVVE